MKKYACNTGPFTLLCDGPSTVEEYNKTGADVVADAVSGCIAWDHLPKLQTKICKVVEEATGIARGIDEKATAAARKTKADAKEVAEKAVPYLKRVWASLTTTNEAGEIVDDVAAQSALNAQVQAEVADVTSIDTTPGSRRTVAGKEANEKAEEILGRTPEAIEETVAKLSAKVPAYVLDRDETSGLPTQESLAMLVRQFMDASKPTI